MLTASLFAIALATPQEGMPKVSAATRAYSLARRQTSYPAYGLAKVRAMIKASKEDEEMNRRLSDANYNRLSFAEKFTYNAIHGEDFSQNCEIFAPEKDEEKKIFAYPPGPFDFEQAWGKRQTDFFQQNRAKVISLLRESMKKTSFVGANYKQIMIDLDAWEMIPEIVTQYKRRRTDHDLLSVMNLFMKKGLYPPFLESQSYTKLYSDESLYTAYLVANKANQDLIMQRAMAYYKTKRK
jgi:hypothetical protein